VCDDTGSCCCCLVFFSTVSRCHVLERGILKLEDCDCGMQPYLPAGLSARVWGRKGRGQTVTLLPVKVHRKAKLCVYGGPKRSNESKW
jgi:hypothetical protein